MYLFKMIKIGKIIIILLPHDENYNVTYNQTVEIYRLYNKINKMAQFTSSQQHLNNLEEQIWFEQNEKLQVICEEDSGFKAWDSSSIVPQNNGTNLFRNLKSQLDTYETKYKKLNIKTLPIKLPELGYMKNIKKYSVNKNQYSCSAFSEQKPLTERKINKLQRQNLLKHKSIELGRKPSRLFNNDVSSEKLKPKNQNNTIQYKQQKPLYIPKVHQMKFIQNQRRLRKRDIYLTIFGERGKNKVQKITFDDENKPYQQYLQRKNNKTKLTTSSNLGSQIQKQYEYMKKASAQIQSKRCISQMNNRYNCLLKKNQIKQKSVAIRF